MGSQANVLEHHMYMLSAQSKKAKEVLCLFLVVGCVMWNNFSLLKGGILTCPMPLNFYRLHELYVKEQEVKQWKYIAVPTTWMKTV